MEAKTYDEGKLYDVAIKVIKQEGTCHAGHKVGDEWIVKGYVCPGICIVGLYTLYPAWRVLRHGGSFPWEADPDVATVPCPDLKNPLVFELRRLKK